MWPSLFQYEDGVMVGEAPDTSDDLLPAKRVKVAHGIDIRTSSDSQTHASPSNDLASETTRDHSIPAPVDSILSPNLQHLHDRFTVFHINVISSSSMHSKVVSLISKLYADDAAFSNPSALQKPPLVVLTSKGKVASKMISIVEVGKETMKKEHPRMKIFQYSKLHGQVAEAEPKAQKNRNEQQQAQNQSRNKGLDGLTQQQHHHASGDGDDAALDGHDDDDGKGHDPDEEAFETMEPTEPLIEPFPNLDLEWRRKLQPVPILTIILSLLPIKELRDVYG
ncbi:MAG: hypothetical protein M1819_001961 [Sarea resinae]|nr:MAG: hypothetical protein M1819_001961 [Sarea resinae]